MASQSTSRPVDSALLVLGGEGLLGGRIVAAARRRGIETVSTSRTAPVSVDLTDLAALSACLHSLAPRTILNCAALADVAACERDPARAFAVNARPVSLLADYAARTGARLAHISTDHFFSGDGRRPHTEADPVRLLNDYARTKYAAEAFALTAPGALVLRTNFLGWPSATGRSLAEWALQVVETQAPADLYADQFVSCLDVWSLAEAVLDLLDAGAEGRLNVGAREVFSKAEFVLALARRLGRDLPNARLTSVAAAGVRRPDSLGLDVSRAEALLGRPFPGLDEVVDSLARHRDPIGAAT